MTPDIVLGAFALIASVGLIVAAYFFGLGER
jgi:hypothetical protein